MSGNRRVQRSVRVMVVSGLLAASSLVVVASVLSDVAVGATALGAVVVGAVCSRIVYSELTQTRREAARAQAAQARSFGATMTQAHREHRAFAAMVASRFDQRDERIGQLEATLHLSERRAAKAESRATQETQTAREAQEQLAALLEAVTQTPLRLVTPESDDVPTMVDLLAWEERVIKAAEAGQAREA